MPNTREAIDRELDVPLTRGGGTFCGVTEERFAIQGVTYAWPRGSHLTWGLAFSRLGQLTDLDIKDAVTAALKEISDCCDVTHEYVSNVNAANFQLTTQRLDAPGGTLADMQIPVGNVAPTHTFLRGRFDDAENWVLADRPAAGTIDFYRVALHELEHAHGLGHKPASIQAPALIAPIYSPVMQHLQKADVDELLRRYGSPPKPPQPPPGGENGPIEGTQVEILIKTPTDFYKVHGTATRV